MPDVFISYAQEDSEIAEAIADGLEEHGFSTWRYEADVGAGDDYLLSTRHNIEACKAFLLLISPDGVDSDQIDKEVVRAHECRKPFVPVLYRIDYDEFGERQPKWQQAIGSATAVVVPKNGDVSVIMPRLTTGMKRLAGEGQAGRQVRRSTIAYSTRRRIKRAMRITRWLAILAVVLAAAAVGGWLYLEKRISQAKQMADRARQEKNPVKAVENLGWVLSWRPHDTEARLLRARLYLQMDQPLDARSDADALLQDDPNNGEAHFLRGRSLQNDGKYVESESEFDLAIKNGWTKSEAYEYRGHALAATSRPADAERDYTVVIERGQGSSDTFYDRALVRIATSQLDAARLDLDGAIDRDPVWGGALAKRGFLRLHQLVNLLKSDQFRAALAGPKQQSVAASVRATLEDVQDDFKRALVSSSIDPSFRDITDKSQDVVNELLYRFQTGPVDRKFFDDMYAMLSGGDSLPAPGPSERDSRPPSAPIGTPTASIRNVRVHYDAVDHGVAGLYFIIDVAISNAANRNCSVAALIKFSNNQPIVCRDVGWRNTRDELMTSAEIRPDRENYVFNDFRVFLPYQRLPEKQRFFNYSMAVVEGPNTISPEVKGQFDGSTITGGPPRTTIVDPSRSRRQEDTPALRPPAPRNESPRSLRSTVTNAARRGQWQNCLEALSRLAAVDAADRVGVAALADDVLKGFYDQFPADQFTPTSARESRFHVAKLRELLLPVAQAGSAYAALLVTESMISYEPDCRVDAIDPVQALRWAEAAADGNLAKGCLYAAQLYGNMSEDAAAAKKSVAYLKRAARLGSADATALLALRFYHYQYQRDKHPFNPDPLLSDERQRAYGLELATSVRDTTPNSMCIYAQYCIKLEKFDEARQFLIRAARAGHPAAKKYCEIEKLEY